MKFNPTLILTTSALALTIGISTPAFAQTPDPVGPADDACAAPATAADKANCPDTTQQDAVDQASQDGDAIVVTGSRIRRDSYNTGENVTIINRDEATQAGFNSTTETLQSTAVTNGTGQINNAFGGFVTDGGPGANTVSLRGLGPTRTLVLLNGRRIAPAGTRGSVGSADLNVLPTSIIDRIEVLKAGASSIYGSDAIAGVINVMTKTKVKGLTLEMQHNLPEVGAGASRRYSLVGGYEGDNWHVSGTVEYYKRDALRLNDRGFTECQTDYRMVNGGDRTPGSGDFIDVNTGEPKCYTITGTGSSGVTINTIGVGGPFSGYVVSPELAPGFPPPPAGRIVLCNRFRPDAAAVGTLPGYECVGGGYYNPNTGAFTATDSNIRNTFEAEMLDQTLVTPAKTLTGYLQGGIETTALGNAEVYGEFLASRRKSSATGYRQLSLDYPRFSPLIPAELQFSNFSGATEVTSGQRVGVRAFIGFGNLENDQEVDYIRAVGGVRGDFFFPDWKYDAFAMKSWTDSEYGQESFITSKVRASLAVDATGQNCVTSALGVAPPAGCVAAPFLDADTIAGNLPQAYRDFIVDRAVGTTKFRETTAGFGVDGPLFALPGGDAAVFLGAEWRKSKINDTPSAESQASDLYNLTSAAITRGSDEVWEVFGEVELPVFDSASTPLIGELTLNGSARYTHYDSYGGDETWKFGGVYSPFEWLSFRGNYGTSYRAPALFEQFLGGTTGFLASTGDPCNGWSAPNVNPIRAANCESEGLPTNFTANTSITVITAGGAESNLAAETSKSWSVGGVLQPDFGKFGSLSFAIDYFRTEVNNGVARAGAGNILSLCYDDPDFREGGGFCNLSSRDANNRLFVNNNYVNLATDIVKGIDFNFRHVVDLGPGRLRLGAQVTKFIDQSNKLFETDPLDDVNGTIGNPKWSGVFDATYDVEQFRFRYGVDWINNTQSYDYFELDPETTPFYLETPDYYLHSASVQWNSGKYSMILGVRNLFDKNPPFISSGVYNRVGNAPLYSGYDYVGRTFFVNVTAALDNLWK